MTFQPLKKEESTFSFVSYSQVYDLVKFYPEILHSICIFTTEKYGSREIHLDYRVLQTIQIKLILLCVWAEPTVLGSTKTALKFRYEIQIG